MAAACLLFLNWREVLHKNKLIMKNQDYLNILKFFLLTALVLLLWYLGWLWLDYLEPDPLKRGTFGDKFGFINSIFSALALAGIVYSIILQQNELTLQRQELAETRDEFIDQNFQTTFFNLLNTQQLITDRIFVKIWYLQSYDKEHGVEFSGRSFFNQSKLELVRILEAINYQTYIEYRPWNEFEGDNDPLTADEADFLIETRQIAFTLYFYKIDKEAWEKAKRMNEFEKGKFAYSTFFRTYNFMSGHYFRHIYHILKFLNKVEDEKLKSCKPEDNDTVKEKHLQFANFVQAQMSTPELFLLYYNSLLFPKLQALLVKYNVLENFTRENLINQQHAVPEIKLKSNRDVIGS